MIRNNTVDSFRPSSATSVQALWEIVEDIVGGFSSVRSAEELKAEYGLACKIVDRYVHNCGEREDISPVQKLLHTSFADAFVFA